MNLPPNIIAKKIVRRLQSAGFAAFWVGGCVRDSLMGRAPQDFDIATDAKPDEVERLFPRTISVGRKFGVVVVLAFGHQFQITTFRAEADYRDGRRPEKIEYANAEADALRRDFTVNGIFYDPVKDEKYDWVGGEKDLRARIIRTIGKPEERFGEDHLRMLRAVRFAAWLNFEIEPATFAAIKKLAPKIKLISAERVRDELVKLFAPPTERINGLVDEWMDGLAGADPKILKSGNPLIQPSGFPPAARGLILLRDSGLLEHILPEFSAMSDCAQSPDFHPEGNVFNHVVLMLAQMPPDAGELLPWAVLLHDIAKPVTAETDAVTGKIRFFGHEKVGAVMAEKILRRLRFPVKQIEEVVVCVKNHMQFKDAKQMRKATLRRLLMRKTIDLEMALHRLDCLGSHGGLEYYHFLTEQLEELKKQPVLGPPLLTGKDLIALGIKPGKELGAWLEEIRELQLSDELQSPKAARTWVKKKLAA